MEVGGGTSGEGPPVPSGRAAPLTAPAPRRPALYPRVPRLLEPPRRPKSRVMSKRKKNFKNFSEIRGGQGPRHRRAPPCTRRPGGSLPHGPRHRTSRSRSKRKEFLKSFLEFHGGQGTGHRRGSAPAPRRPALYPQNPHKSRDFLSAGEPLPRPRTSKAPGTFFSDA